MMMKGCQRANGDVEEEIFKDDIPHCRLAQPSCGEYHADGTRSAVLMG